jgi:hypothetical protein
MRFLLPLVVRLPFGLAKQEHVPSGFVRAFGEGSGPVRRLGQVALALSLQRKDVRKVVVKGQRTVA